MAQQEESPSQVHAVHKIPVLDSELSNRFTGDSCRVHNRIKATVVVPYLCDSRGHGAIVPHITGWEGRRRRTRHIQ
jgi:hypothetical protein